MTAKRLWDEGLVFIIEKDRRELRRCTLCIVHLQGYEVAFLVRPFAFEVAEVAKECGYLPLALAMIGAMVRLDLDARPTAWRDALTRLRRADLEAIKRTFPGYPYPDLFRAIEVSVEALNDPEREHYLDLAVFPPDQPIPEAALCVRWGLDGIDVRDCMRHLVARSLATWPADGTSLILHDLQRDLIQKRREKNLPALHLRLLKAWDALPLLSEPYVWRWVAYRLKRAACEKDLRCLLLNFEYLQGKILANDVNGLIVDYDLAADDEELRLIQSTLRISAHVLARDGRQLTGQLTGRLLGNTSAGIKALLKQAWKRKSWPWLRALLSSLTGPGTLIRVFEGHTGWVQAVAVTPDGRLAVSAASDKTLRVWDLESGQTLRSLQGHTDSVFAVSVTPDEQRLQFADRPSTSSPLPYRQG